LRVRHIKSRVSLLLLIQTNYMENDETKKRIGNLQSKLYYINNKEEHNKKRKNYKRQAWEDRKDNPKNKEII